MKTGFSQGVACALGAGLLWGLVFVVPVLLPDYPAILLSCGRYLAFGLVSLLPAWWLRADMARLTRTDWAKAAELSVVGNLMYYAALSASIQLAGAPVPTLMIGLLPVVIAVVGNVRFGNTASNASVQAPVAWQRLALPSVVMAAGLLLVHSQQPHAAAATSGAQNTALGYALALLAVAAWTWYPLRNAAHMRAQPHISSAVWASAQGVVTIPLAAAGYALYGVFNQDTQFNYPLGAQPALYIAVMLVLGICASWLGTLLWNRASQLLPPSLAGQLIVFETLAALAYNYMYAGAWPSAGVALGVAGLVAGVVLGLRVFRAR